MPSIDNKTQTLAGQLKSLQLRMANQVQTKSWRDMLHTQHDRAFTVAGAMQADLLAALAKAVDDSISKGLGLQYFRKQFDKIVEQYGWAYNGERRWRTRVIYGTNMRVSYAAGRLVQLRDPELRKLAPFWMYRHSGAEHPRLQHKAWDKLCLPADDPWFQTHYPPNGWGCGCRVLAVSARDIARMGGRIEIPPEGTDGIDEGWDYMPGGSVTDELQGVVEAKAATLPAVLAQAFKADADARLVERIAIDEVVKLGIIDGLERSILIKNGKRIATAKGTPNQVAIAARAVDFENASLIHNHPESGSLSQTDLVDGKRVKLRAITAAGHDGSLYTARLIQPEIGDYFAANEQKLNTYLSRMDNPPSEADYERWQYHIINRLLEKAGMMQYEFIGIELEPSWVQRAIAAIK